MNSGRFVDTSGRFSGYASLFGMPDQAGDIVMPGAFAASLKAKAADRVRMLFQHDPKEPIGIWDRVVEDANGLWVEGRLQDGVARAEALKRLIEGGGVDGLSIGFRTVRATRENAGTRRRLWQIDLWEISIVTFPMMDGARIVSDARMPAASDRLKRSLDATIAILRN